VTDAVPDRDDALEDEVAPREEGLGLRRLGGNAARTFIAQVAAMALGVSLSLLLARTLGEHGVGTYATALLLPLLMAQLLELGITYSNVYHIGRGDVNAHDVMRANVRIWAVVSAVGLIVSAVVIWFWGAEWFPGIDRRLLMVSALAFPPALLQLYCLSILQGYQDFKRYNYLTVIVRLTTLVLSAIMLIGFHQGVVAVLGAYLVGELISVSVALILIRPYLARAPEAEVHESWWHYGRQAVSYGWKQHLSAIISFVNLRVALFCVNLFLTPAAAGIYFVAIQFGEAMWVVSKVVSTVLLPRLAELHDREEARLQLTPLVTRLVFAFTAVASIVAALLIGPVVTLGWGKSFAGVAPVLWWMLPGIVMWSATRVLAYDFAARGRPELNSYLAGVVLVVNGVLNVVLIPRLGVTGGAISTTVAYTANTFATAFLYRRFSDLPSWRLFVLQREDFALLGKVVKVARAKVVGG
jgi:O-antigen/teichoic acid export membrane protein